MADGRLEPELDNLRAALAWSQSAAGTEELSLRLAGAMMGLWLERGYWNEARGFLEDTLHRAQPSSDPPARARVLRGLGTVAYFQGEYAVACAYLLDSLSLSREQNDRLATAATLMYLGDIALEQGDGASALERTQESVALYRELGNTAGIGWALNQMGMLAIMHEDAARAKASLDEALALGREIAETVIIFWALHGLGLAAQLDGDFARAWQLHSESLAQWPETGEPNDFVSWAYQALGETALAQGDAALAAQHFLKALRLFCDFGDRGAISFCLAGLAGVAVADGEPKRAAQVYGAADALRRAIGARQAPATHVTRERLIASAREQLGDERFDVAWAEGSRLTIERAIDLALSEGGTRP